MATGASSPGAAERIERRCRELAGDERPLRKVLLELLRGAVAFDWYAWLLTDPETEVGSAPLAEVPSVADLPRLIRSKYLTTVNRWTAVDQPVTALHTSTDGDLERSLMWRDVLAAYDIVDVASLVFRDDHGCWGWLDLWRSAGHRRFDDRELDYLAAIAAPVTEALRRAQARTFDDVTPSPDRAGPVALLLSPTLEVKAQTPETQRYLRALVPPEGDGRPVPAGAYNVAAQLLALEAGVDDHQPTARVHLDGGAWLTLRAARAAPEAPETDHDIAVTIEPSSPSERRELFARSHALSPRETEVLDHLLRGGDTRAIAKALYVSQHTVQDHLKSIFAKTGNHSRRALLTRVAGR
jgi:DNA-binding CsgD family transcriptional regulator